MSKIAKLADAPEVLFENRLYRVTLADIQTPHIYYPIADTVGRVRRDVLFACLFFVAVIGAGAWLYFDLLYAHERLIVAGLIALALLIGSQVSILQLDARGFPPRLFIARAKTVRAIFNAITLARARSAQVSSGTTYDDHGS